MHKGSLEVDDRELAERCLASDQTAVRKFVERFQEPIFAICLRYLGHREDAEDVAQQSLIRAIRHLHNWDTNRPLKPWIMAIAVNRCRTYASQRPRQTMSYDFTVDAPARQSGLERVGLAEELQNALSTLREEYRTCFILFHQQELSIFEVADIMKCPEGTIKTWLHRARKELAAILTERGVVTKDGHELHRF